MIKAPWWRVAGWELVAPEVREQVRVAAEELVTLLPFAARVREPQIVGSYARMRAQLHSDLDIHLELLDHTPPRPSLAQRPEIARRLVVLLSTAGRRLGIRVDLSIRPYSEVDAGKQTFGLRSNLWFNKAAGDASDDHIFYDRVTNERKVRRRAVGRYGIDSDPWAAEVETWAARYGTAFQRFGFTEDTAWRR